MEEKDRKNSKSMTRKEHSWTTERSNVGLWRRGEESHGLVYAKLTVHHVEIPKI
jgi:hypothetical protein